MSSCIRLSSPRSFAAEQRNNGDEFKAPGVQKMSFEVYVHRRKKLGVGMDRTELQIDEDQMELLTRNVPTDFKSFVKKQSDRRRSGGNSNQIDESLIRFGEVISSLEISNDPNYRIRGATANRLMKILDVYLAMKASVDQLINTKEVLMEINKLDRAIKSVALSLKNDARDHLITERNLLSDISEVGDCSDDFNRSKQIDEKIAIARQMTLKMSAELKGVKDYFKYKGGLISGSGRRKNDYSLHYLVFALGGVFQDVNGTDVSVMVSFNDDEEPTSKFWSFIRSFCENCDPDLMKEFSGNFAQTVKNICRRYQKADHSVSELTDRPDTQRLLDFMVVVHRAKSRKQ